MATQITLTAFQTACGAIADAILASDFKTANLQLGVATAIYHGLANQKVMDQGASAEMFASLEDLRRTVETIRLNSVQDVNSDVVISVADFSGTRS